MGFISCDQKINYPYEGKDRIQFKHFSVAIDKREEFDSLTFSMGLLNDTILTDTAKVVIELLGKLSDTERNYKVSIVADSTTTEAGIHYEIFNEIQSFRKKKTNDTLRIVLNRQNFSSNPSEKENRILYLKLEPTDDFELGLTKGRTMKMVLNNYLSEPNWWSKQHRGIFGFFHVKKWKILISFNEEFATYNDLPFRDQSAEAKAYQKGLESYLQNVPTYDDYTGDRIKMYSLEPQDK